MTKANAAPKKPSKIELEALDKARALADQCARNGMSVTQARKTMKALNVFKGSTAQGKAYEAAIAQVISERGWDAVKTDPMAGQQALF